MASKVAAEQPFDDERTARAAWWYYVDGLTQEDIARLLRVSRATAGRLLERSRATGIVNISIATEYYSPFTQAKQLKERYALADALVLPPLASETSQDPGEFLTQRLAKAAAQVLRDYLGGSRTLGIGWGETVAATFGMLPPDVMGNVKGVSLTGGVNTYVSTIGQLRQSSKRSVQDGFIPAPILVSDEALARALCQEQGVSRLLEEAKRVDVAIVGIGPLDATASLARAGYATVAELASYARTGAVGDILGVFFDAKGAPLDLPVHRRRIGIDIADLRSIPIVIGVAGGIDKLEAIRGALAGGYIDVLVTDGTVADGLLGSPGDEN